MHERTSGCEGKSQEYVEWPAEQRNRKNLISAGKAIRTADWNNLDQQATSRFSPFPPAAGTPIATIRDIYWG